MEKIGYRRFDCKAAGGSNHQGENSQQGAQQVFARLPNYSMPADSDFEELPCKRSKKDKQHNNKKKAKDSESSSYSSDSSSDVLSQVLNQIQ